MAKKRLKNFNESFIDPYENPSLLTKFDVEEKAHIEIDPVYGDAILQAKKVRDKIKDDFKEQDKIVKDFLSDYDLEENPELPEIQDKKSLKDMKLIEMLDVSDLIPLKESNEYSDDKSPESALKMKVANYLKNKIMDFINDNIPAQQVAADVPEYDADYCSEEPTSNINKAMLKITFLVEKISKLLLNVYFSDLLRFDNTLIEDFNPDTVHDFIDDFIDMESLGQMAYRWMTSQELCDMLEANGVESDELYESLKENVSQDMAKMFNDYFRHHLYGNEEWAEVEDIKEIDNNIYEVDVKYSGTSHSSEIDDDGVSYDVHRPFEEHRTSIVRVDDSGRILEIKDKYDESLNESKLNEDYANFLGRPLKDFLKTLNSNEKINIDYETNTRDGLSGVSGRVNQVPWDVADRLIKDIQLGDESHYKFKILTESAEENKKKDLNEARRVTKLPPDEKDESHKYKVVVADENANELFIKNVKGFKKLNNLLSELDDNKLNSINGATQLYVTRDDDKEVYLKFINDDGSWDVIQDDVEMEKPAEERDSLFNHVVADLNSESSPDQVALRKMSRKGEGYVGFENDEIGFKDGVFHLKSQSDKPIEWAKKVAEFYGFTTSKVELGKNNYKYIDIFANGIEDDPKLAL